MPDLRAVVEAMKFFILFVLVLTGALLYLMNAVVESLHPFVVK